MTIPTVLDYWVAGHLGSLLGRSRIFDRMVLSGISHEVLGGFWFALVLFVLWAGSSDTGDRADPVTQRRILVTLAGSMIAIGLSFVAAAWLSWLPPNRMPGLAQQFPYYFRNNPNVSSFPSQSTTLYTAVAAGIYSLRKRIGVVLLVAVIFLIALPRMYVGGHYLTDVLVGLVLGFAGYGVARLAEARLPAAWSDALGRADWLRLTKNVVVFVWLLQVAVEFRDASWAAHVAHLVLRHVMHG